MKCVLVLLSTITLTVLLLGCENDPVSVNSTTNPDVPVALLFENEGCKVYRFNDSGRNHYYANCEYSSSVMETQTEHCGKGCQTTYSYETPTRYRGRQH